MTTQTREQELIIETNRAVVENIDLGQEKRQGDPGKSAVQVQSEVQEACPAIPDQGDGSPGGHSITKVLVRLVRPLAIVFDLLVSPPATERGHIENAMVKAKHDRYISFLR